MVSHRNGDSLAIGLDIELLNDSIINQHGEAVAADATQFIRQVQIDSSCLAKLGVVVGQEADLALGVHFLSESLHDVRIVGCHANNFVDSILLEFFVVLEIAWQMFL